MFSNISCYQNVGFSPNFSTAGFEQLSKFFVKRCLTYLRNDDQEGLNNQKSIRKALEAAHIKTQECNYSKTNETEINFCNATVIETFKYLIFCTALMCLAIIRYV